MNKSMKSSTQLELPHKFAEVMTQVCKSIEISYQENLRKTAVGTQLTCDLGRINYFVDHRYSTPPPVLVAFGSERIHRCKMTGTWDWVRAEAENSEALIQSVRTISASHDGNSWNELVFQFGDRLILHANESDVIGYAPTLRAAERLVREFAALYKMEKVRLGGSFQLVRKECYGEIKCQQVHLSSKSLLSDETFALHYPGDGWIWHSSFVKKLREHKNGLSILEGPPGTGKTSYLRHLMGLLQETHRFYFIPPSHLEMLEEPEFIGFWSDQIAEDSNRQLVIILEDSEGNLMQRGSDNHSKVSAILNLADGLLSDFLRLQVICTMNCTCDDIDPALLRPGRLLSYRVFNRLQPEHAKRLATSLGKSLPSAEDYSLGEIFAGQKSMVAERQKMGF